MRNVTTGRGVNDQLPRIRRVKHGPSYEPDKNDKHSYRKRPGAAEHGGGTVRKNAERVRTMQRRRVPVMCFSSWTWVLFTALLSFAPDCNIARTVCGDHVSARDNAD
jgi:hypothetical protein